MDLIFHAQDTTYKSPFGAVSAGTPIRFQADLPKDGTLVQPQLLVCRDGQWDQPQIIPMTLQQTLPTKRIVSNVDAGGYAQRTIFDNSAPLKNIQSGSGSSHTTTVTTPERF